MLALFSCFRNTLNKLDAYMAYVVFAALLFLIVNWLFNHSSRHFRVTMEGNTNSAAVKCPEDCTSVKELHTKLSDAMKRVQTLEASIIQNTNTGIAHATAVADMNKSINEMQSNQKNE